MGDAPLDALGAGLSVLVVEDEPSVRLFLDMFLSGLGFEVLATENCADGARAARVADFDLALVDKNLPDGNGLDVIRAIREAERPCEIVLMTAYGNMESAVEALKLGVAEYLQKPFPEAQVFEQIIRRMVDVHRLKAHNRRLVDELTDKNRALEALAVRDPLTRLFNHAHLQETLEREIVRAARTGDPCSLLFVDLDSFKDINDRLGHAAGDRLLTAVSAIITGTARRSDFDFRLRSEDIPARYGGDEFAVVLPDTTKIGATVFGERLRVAVAAYDFTDDDLPPQTVSIGIATCPDDAENRISLIKCADRALYQAKRLGRNRSITYSPTLRGPTTVHAAESNTTEIRIRALDESLDEHAFDYVYQPIVVADTRRPLAYEALCRPRHAAFPNPWVLIQTAERVGRLSQLGRALREGSVVALERLPGDVSLFLNIHPQELHDPRFHEIEPFLAPWAGRVVFELTEVAQFKNYDRVRAIIKELQAAGFRVALDDLGAGYSGLNSLAMLEPDYVKLDMEMVHRVAVDRRARRLAKHLIEFATDEGMHVIAEGIETEDQRDAITDLGCTWLQGWLFGKGAPLDEIVE